MDTCVIFCAGGFDRLAEPIGAGDLLIAADGGLVHMQGLNLTPHILLGDFDSLGYIPEGAQVFPVEKDDTDSMLAIRKGLEKGYRRFVLYGALDGPRLDHTLANLQALCFLAHHGARGYLAGQTTMATVFQNEQAVFAPSEGIFSLFCLGQDARVSLSGLQYELEDGILSHSFPLGVSNHFMGRQATVTVTGGCVAALYPIEIGFPVRKEVDL